MVAVDHFNGSRALSGMLAAKGVATPEEFEQIMIRAQARCALTGEPARLHIERRTVFTTCARSAKGWPQMRKFAGFARSLRQWTWLMTHPGVVAFDAQRARASWRAVWWSVAAQAVIEGCAVAWVIAGPGSRVGVSLLPFGPKLQLPREPLWLGLAAFAGSFLEFFLFSSLLLSSARLLGGRGAFLTQAFLMALFWVPLMAISALAQLLGVIGSVIGLAARTYALVLLGPMLASAHDMPLKRAWLALLIVVALGALLALITFVFAGARLGALLR